MNRFQTAINWAAALTQMSHFFCCGLPLIFGVLSLLSGFGIMVTLPLNEHDFHHMLHDYEVPFLTFAAIILLIGWALHYISWKIDCRSTGCSHEPCAPKKRRSSKVLFISTALFIFNIIVFLTAHGSH